MTSSFAIQIMVNNVILDLNGRKLQGQGAGPGTQAAGIVSLDRKNVTIRNGTVRGFAAGIALSGFSDTKSQGHVIEDMRLDSNTQVGIFVRGVGSVIRNNLVVAAGGSTVSPNLSSEGIRTAGALHRVLNNDILNTLPTGTGFSNGIVIGCPSQGVAVENNRVSNSQATTPGQTFGLRLSVDLSNAVLVNNRFMFMTQAIFCDPGSSGMMRDNLSIGTGGAAGYFGCTDAGNNI
jgi:hypothetical protein